MKRYTAMCGTAALAMVAALVAARTARAAVEGDEAKTAALAIGDAAPAWESLDGIDGKQHSLADLKDAKAVLVVFTCNHCPVAKAYEDRLVALYNDYHDQGVEIVAINVNNVEADKMPAMKERAKAKGFEFAYLYDPSQEIGRDFGASVTPHAFVLDGKQRVVYRGAIDDNMDADRVQAHYVRDVLDAVLAGHAPETDETKPAGCGIQYE